MTDTAPSAQPAAAAAPSPVRVTSEIGPLRTVICHTPGKELLAVTPSNREQFLYDDIIDLDQARREHQRFRSLLARFCDVLEVRELLAEIVDEPEVRRFLVHRVMEVSASEPLGGYLGEVPGEDLIGMFIEGREAPQGPISRLLHKVSYELPPLPNLFFTRDAAMVVNGAVIIGAMKYAVRWTEELLMKALFKYHPLLRNDGFIYDGTEEHRSDYTIEGGDVLILRPDLAVIGLSERSSPAAIEGLVESLRTVAGVEHVLVVVLPSESPAIHLDMIMTMVDREHCVVYPPYFFGPARLPVLYYRPDGKGVKEYDDVFQAVRKLGMPLEPIFCGGQHPTLQEREQWSSGCNFVAVRPGVVLGYARNEATMREMETAAGYRVIRALDFLTGEEDLEDGDRAVIAFEGAELVRGGGRRAVHDDAGLQGRHLVSGAAIPLEGVRFRRDGSLTERALRVLGDAPLPTAEVAGRVMGITGGGSGAAAAAVFALLGADPRFRVSAEGVWSVAAAPAPPPPRTLLQEEWVVVDVETTGTSPERGDRVTEVAAVRVSGGQVRDTFSTLVNPDRPIPPMITSITGITAEMVAGKPRFREIAGDLAAHLEGRVFVAHNAPFDWRFVCHEVSRATGMTPAGRRLCTVALARRLLPELRSRSLDGLATYFGLEIESRHRALDDAVATAHVLLRLIGMLEERGVSDWAGLQGVLGARAPRTRGRRATPRSLESA